MIACLIGQHTGLYSWHAPLASPTPRNMPSTCSISTRAATRYIGSLLLQTPLQRHALAPSWNQGILAGHGQRASISVQVQHTREIRHHATPATSSATARCRARGGPGASLKIFGILSLTSTHLKTHAFCHIGPDDPTAAARISSIHGPEPGTLRRCS